MICTDHKGHRISRSQEGGKKCILETHKVLRLAGKETDTYRSPSILLMDTLGGFLSTRGTKST